MGAPPDYYRILHVQPDAPTAVIHAIYRTLLQRLQTSATFAGEADAGLIEEAYAVLGDAQRRAAYDAHRRAASTKPAPAHEAQAHATDDDTETLIVNVCLFCGAQHGLKRKLDRDDECGICRSPLCPAERHRLEYSGQRMLNRIPKQRRVDLYVTWPQQPAAGEMRDLSLNGMQFTSAIRLQPNQIVKIDCHVLSALARVAHSAPDPDAAGRWTTGVEFLTLRFIRIRGSFVSTEV